jgi:hypothetical protein
LDAVDVELLMSIDIEKSKAVTGLLREYVDAVAGTTAFLAIETEKAKRATPNYIILSIEKSQGFAKNPLRFSWNDEKDDKTLKVNTKDFILFCRLKGLWLALTCFDSFSGEHHSNC